MNRVPFTLLFACIVVLTIIAHIYGAGVAEIIVSSFKRMHYKDYIMIILAAGVGLGLVFFREWNHRDFITGQTGGEKENKRV